MVSPKKDLKKVHHPLNHQIRQLTSPSPRRQVTTALNILWRPSKSRLFNLASVSGVTELCRRAPIARSVSKMKGTSGGRIEDMGRPWKINYGGL